MVPNDEHTAPRGFKVEDRRRFSESGDARPDAPEAPAGPNDAAAPAPEPPAPTDEPPELTFLTFLLGLSTEALAYLGEIPHPITRQVQPELPAAKHLIDILGLLREKTHGNLDPGEAELLERVLYDLRLKYVERVRTK
jgi:hypothetical protein